MSEEHKKQAIQTEFYTKAVVHRENLTEQNRELTSEANAHLAHIGEQLIPGKGYKYRGSIAVHIYTPDLIQELAFVSQTGTMRDLPETLASKALEALKSDCMESYGRRRAKRRSGF